MGWIGGAIAGLGALAGGLVGKRGAQDAANFQKKYAKHGIEWRVADAKRAGLHPLYALGAPAFGGAPINTDAPLGEALANMGQHLGRAADTFKTADERKAQALNEALIQAKIKESEERAAMFNRSQRGPGGLLGQSQLGPPLPDLIKPKADEQISASSQFPGRTAGTHPAEREYTVGRYGLKMLLPYSEEGPSEAMENVPLWAWPALIQHNRAVYGDDWGTRFLKEFVFDVPGDTKTWKDRDSEVMYSIPEGVKKYLKDNPRR